MIAKDNLKFAKKNRETIFPSRQALLINDALAVLLFATSIILSIMLATYSPVDKCWFKSSDILNVNNKMGLVGSYTADIFLSVFGNSSWWVVIGIFYLGYRKIIRNKIDVGNWYNIFQLVSFLVLFMASSLFEYIALYSRQTQYLHNGYGGILGHSIFEYASPYLGQFGLSLISFFTLIISFTFTFSLSLVSMVEKTGYAIEWLYRKTIQLVRAQLENSAKYNDVVLESCDLVKLQELHLDELDNENIPETPPKKSILQSIVKIKPKSEKKLNKETDLSIVNSIGGFPSTALLNSPKKQVESISQETIEFVSMSIENKLAEFGVEAKITNAESGPVITRYELLPSHGVRGEKIVGLAKEIARGLALTNVRIVETIPGKNSMGIEVPNFKRQTIYLKEIFDSKIYSENTSKLVLALGKDITGEIVITDLAKMPHLLVAGTTGSGKSVAINAMILSILFQASPNEVKFIMIDPKMVELSFYHDIPHLLTPVVTDMTQAANALKWAVAEMERRYKVMAKFGCKNINSFNYKIIQSKNQNQDIYEPLNEGDSNQEDREPLSPWPFIVIIIDELADLMMVAGKKIEQYIARIAQKARAVGIHLIVATQRPSVDVITGLIKANIPARISFQVSSKIDSRTILDQMGAETLLGQGDMLFLQPGTGFPQRIHGAFVDDDELHKVVEFLKTTAKPNYVEEILNGTSEGADLFGDENENDDNVEKDDIFDEAVKFIYDTKRCSISSLQTRFGIGYNRAARIMAHLEKINMVKRNERGGFELLKTSTYQ